MRRVPAIPARSHEGSQASRLREFTYASVRHQHVLRYGQPPAAGWLADILR